MKIRIYKSIRARLSLWYGLVLAIIIIGSDFILYMSFKNSQLDTIDATLFTAAEDVESIIFQVPPEKWKEDVKRVERGFLVNRLFIQLVEIPPETRDFRLVARSGVLSGNISQRMIWERLAHRIPDRPVFMNVNEESPGSHPMRLILYPVFTDSSHPYIIQVGTSLKKLFSMLKNLKLVLMFFGPVLLAVSALGGFVILTGALRPMQEVVRTARRISTEDLSLRIDSKHRTDELGVLITTFNHMIERLERSVTQIKQFSSDASHDLKTPLTIIRGEIDIALRKDRSVYEYRRTLASVKDEAQKLERVIDNLLFLSRIDVRDYHSAFQPVNLDEILLELYEKTQPMAAAKSIVYLIGKMESVVVSGDDILLNRLIVNLMDNAIKYTPNGGQIEISLEIQGESALLSVQDNGIGIPAASMPFIFDSFYRVDQSRTHRCDGSGLGLSIVKRIADIHHASITIESQENVGTCARFSIPVKPLPAPKLNLNKDGNKNK